MEFRLLGIKSSSHTVSVPAGGAIFLETDRTGPLGVGAARITSDVPIGVSGVFTILNTAGEFETEAGIGSSPALAAQTIPIQRQAGRDTGLALYNPNDESATLSLQLQTADGSTARSTSTLILEPGSHQARFVSELIEGVGEFSGSMALYSTQPVCALTLRQNAEPLSFTTLPVASGAHGFSRVASQPIGPSGGMISTPEFQLTVPNGAFDSETGITVRQSDAFSLFGKESTPAFLIEGVPFNSKKPLQVRLKYEGDPIDLPLIALGVETYVSSLNRLETTYSFIETAVEAGYLVGNLYFDQDSIQNKNTLALSPGEVANVGGNLIVTGVFGWEKHTTANFVIYAQRVPEKRIALVKTALEDAWKFFKETVGFDFSVRTRWPVEIVIRPLAEKGYYTNSYKGTNYGFIELDSGSLNDERDLRATIGHEFCHLVQGLYDPRNRLAKAALKPVFHWLNEAVAVWSEKYFYYSNARERARYVPPNFIENEDRIFFGMQAGNDNDDHGYGIAAVMETYAKSQEMGKLVEVYEKLRSGTAAVAALVQTRPLDDWWWEFWKKYLEQGFIYSGRSEIGNKIRRCADPEASKMFPCTPWLVDIAKGFESKSKEEKSRHRFDVSLPDLSAGIYLFLLKLDPAWPFKIRYRGNAALGDPFQDTQIVPMVLHEEDFSYPPSGPVYASRGLRGLCASGGCEPVNRQWTDTLTSGPRPDIYTDALRQPGYHLGFLVINGRLSPPYTNLLQFDLEVDFSFPYYVRTFPAVQVKGVIKRSDGFSETRQWGLDSPDHGPYPSDGLALLHHPHHMTVKYTDVPCSENDGLLCSCDATAQFDPTQRTITANWNLKTVSVQDPRVFTEWEVSLQNLPPDPRYPDANYFSLLEHDGYTVSGDICPYLTKARYRKQWVNGSLLQSQELESYDCSDGEIYLPLRKSFDNAVRFRPWDEN